MMAEIVERIEKNVDQLFSKVNELGNGIARIDVILPRIEKMLNGLPCEKREREIAKIDKEVYADKHVRTAIVGGLGVIGMVLGAIAIMGQILGWF